MIQDPGITPPEELDWRLHSCLMHMTFRTADASCGLQAAAPGEIRRSPLYAQVSAAIERRLLERAWPIDSALPPEPELARIFGVSVGTVRKAVDELEAHGRLVRRHGSGTYVRRFGEGGYWNRFQRFQTRDRMLIRWSARLVRLERIPADETVARMLSLEPGEEVIHVVRLVTALNNPDTAGLAASWDQSWLNARLFAGLDAKAYETWRELSLYEVYERAAGVVITDVSDTLETVAELPNPIDASQPPSPGPFFLLTRIARTFMNVPAEYRLEAPPCAGIKVVFNE